MHSCRPFQTADDLLHTTHIQVPVPGLRLPAHQESPGVMGIL